MNTLSQFTSELRNRNVAKSSMFYAEIVAPSLIQSDLNSVSLWCDMAQTPQSTILTQDNHIEAGVKRKYAYDQEYTNLTLDFYIDQEYKIKHFFQKWKDLTVPTNRNFGYPRDYTVDRLNVYAINAEGTAAHRYEYLNVFPKAINATELSYENTDAVAKFSVDFVFENVNSVHYLNGRELRALSKEKILIPGSGANEIIANRFPSGQFYDNFGSINNPTGIPLDVAKFLTYESLFNDLVNIRIPSRMA